MANVSWSPRLMTVLGVSDAGQIREADLDRLVAERVTESVDLDFKREPYASKRVRDAAVDVAAMANARGGVLLFGIDEEDAAASAVVPFDVDPDVESRRIRSSVADHVSPVPEFDISFVELSGGRVMAIVVPPSPRAPHAVARSNSPTEPHWSWPARHGTQTRYLSEPEIGDRYSLRTRTLQAEAERLGAAVASLRTLAPDTAGERWLTVALAPAVPGSVDLSAWDRESVIERVSQPLMHGSPERRAPVHVGYWQPFPRLARLLLADSGRKPRRIAAELHRDGLAVASVQIEGAPGGAQMILTRSHVFRALCAALGSAHFLASSLAGAAGSDSLLQIRLDTSKVLVGDYGRFDRLNVDEDGPRGEALVFDRSLDLDHAMTTVGYRNALALAANTLWNGLGRAVCPYLDAAGQPTVAGQQLLERW